MDDLQLLREMRSATRCAPPATLAHGRTKLMTRIDSASTSAASTDTHAKGTVSPIRFRRRVLLASAAAALLVGGIVVANVLKPCGRAQLPSRRGPEQRSDSNQTSDRHCDPAST